LDQGISGTEVWILRIADDQISHDLRAQAHPFQLIRRADAPLLKLAMQDLGREWPARGPQTSDEQERESKEREQTKRKNTLPSALADDDRLATPVFTPPLDHRPLITLPIRSRSVSGTNEALHQGRLVA
jgi:hypothetical protein